MCNTALVCCGDRRLNQFARAISENAYYQIRSIGLPFDWAINQGALFVLYSQLTTFPEGELPITEVFVLVHTDCLAVQKSGFFKTLGDKRRERYENTPDGERDFCTKQLEKIKNQTRQLGDPGKIVWRFGIIDTGKAVELRASCTRCEALECIDWPFEEKP